MRLALSILLLLLLASGCSMKSSSEKVEYKPVKKPDILIMEGDSPCDSATFHDDDYKTILTE